MYHYKAPHDGCTRHSVKGLKYIDKLGKLISIEAYTVANREGIGCEHTQWINNKIRIRVTGENGTCIYGGFLWGYGGEGPHGLRDLFIKCGMEKQLADHYSFTGTLGDNNVDNHNSKLYNKTTLWKFVNSDLGWNRVIIEPPVKFIKGQQLICQESINKLNFKCTFVKYSKNNKAVVKYDIPLIQLYNIKQLVHVDSLTAIKE